MAAPIPTLQPTATVSPAPAPASALRISVIIPVYNGGANFEQCLTAIPPAQPPPFEVIVVDDGSTDDSRQRAVAHGMCVLESPAAQNGPAIGRNLGAAHAQGEILFFLDADVSVVPDVYARLTIAFADPNLAALFGSYDRSPAAPSFIAQYKNLMHHYTHQTSGSETTSFWAGCGAIRRQVFESVGGFKTTFTRPCIEDIELGYRLRRAGYHVRLDKELQVKHLKQWTLRSMIVTDIFDRALPWTRLLKYEHAIPNDLNLQTANRISAALAWLSLLTLCVAPFFVGAWLAALGCATVLVYLNAPLYRFLWHERGFGFMLAAIPLHWLYYLYSSAAFVYVWFIERE